MPPLRAPRWRRRLPKATSSSPGPPGWGPGESRGAADVEGGDPASFATSCAGFLRADRPPGPEVEALDGGGGGERRRRRRAGEEPYPDRQLEGIVHQLRPRRGGSVLFPALVLEKNCFAGSSAAAADWGPSCCPACRARRPALARQARRPRVIPGRRADPASRSGRLRRRHAGLVQPRLHRPVPHVELRLGQFRVVAPHQADRHQAIEGAAPGASFWYTKVEDPAGRAVGAVVAEHRHVHLEQQDVPRHGPSKRGRGRRGRRSPATSGCWRGTAPECPWRS